MTVTKEVSPCHFLFFFLFLYQHTPHFLIQSFVSWRICFSSFASEVDLGQRHCIGIPKSVKKSLGVWARFQDKESFVKWNWLGSFGFLWLLLRCNASTAFCLTLEIYLVVSWLFCGPRKMVLFFLISFARHILVILGCWSLVVFCLLLVV